MEYIIILLVIIIFVLIYIILRSKKTKQPLTVLPEAINENKHTINSSDSANHKKQKKRTKSAYRTTQKMRWRDKMLDISMIPQTVELDKNTLLPQAIKREFGYGKRFNTFYSDDDSTYYHRSTCKNIKGKKQLVHRYIALTKLYPCPICQPNALIDDWFIEFAEKNFKKFTTYSDFQAWAKLNPVALPDSEENILPEVAQSDEWTQMSLFDSNKQQ